MSALRAAVLDNRPTQVRLLLKAGCKVNKRTGGGQTVLMCCCEMNQDSAGLKMAKLLHKQGARLDLQDNRNHNALMLAVINRKSLIIDFLVQNCGEFDLNARDNDSNSALHLAVWVGDLDIVKSLVRAMLKYRLDMSTRNNSGLTPFMMSVALGKTDIQMYLRGVQDSKTVPSEHPVFMEGNDANGNWRNKNQYIENILNCSLVALRLNGMPAGTFTNDIRPKQFRSTSSNDNPVKDSSGYCSTAFGVVKLGGNGSTEKQKKNGMGTRFAGQDNAGPGNIARSKTSPQLLSVNRSEKQTTGSLTSFSTDNLTIPSDSGSEGSSPRWNLPKLYDVWQNQLCRSYLPPAVPIYEEPSHSADDRSILGPATPMIGFSRPQSRRTDDRRAASPFSAFKPTAELPPSRSSSRSARRDTLDLPRISSLRLASAGRRCHSSQRSRLRSSPDGRARSAAPAPVIMVESI